MEKTGKYVPLRDNALLILEKLDEQIALARSTVHLLELRRAATAEFVFACHIEDHEGVRVLHGLVSHGRPSKYPHYDGHHCHAKGRTQKDVDRTVKSLLDLRKLKEAP